MFDGRQNREHLPVSVAPFDEVCLRQSSISPAEVDFVKSVENARKCSSGCVKM